MNQALDYMIKNRKKVIIQALKITKNRQVAEDIVQDVMIYFYKRPGLSLRFPAGYVWRALLTTYLNSYKGYEDKMQFDGLCTKSDRAFSHFDTAIVEDTLESKLDMEKLLDVAEKICYPQERRAIKLFLKHATSSLPGENDSTLRTNMSLGIEKLKFFVENGTAPKNNKGKNSSVKKKVKYGKDSTNARFISNFLQKRTSRS